MKTIVTKDNFMQQVQDYQNTLGFFSDRQLVGIFKKTTDVRVFWKQWYSQSENEYLAFVHLMERDGKIEVVNASVS